MKFARDGYLPTAVVLAAALPLAFLGWYVAASALVLLAVGVLLFFRDPERAIPQEPGLIVSPADGKVVGVAETGDEGDAAIRLSIFMSVFDVHINRAPVAGRVESVRYSPGAFLPAFNDKASQRNEQNRIEMDDGVRRLAMVQIAGLVARRIVCHARPGDRVERGQRVGLIKFGSRVDLYLPRGIELRVKVGDRVSGGSSVIGRWPDASPERG